jgi:hypothetical protein
MRVKVKASLFNKVYKDKSIKTISQTWQIRIKNLIVNNF